MSMTWEVFSPEQLTVHADVDIDLLCPAWVALDLANLSVPQTTFENRVAPGVAGSNPLAGIEDQLSTTLPFHLTGFCDRFGVEYASMQTGFRRNWVFLCQGLFIPDGATTAWDATYTPPDEDEDPIEFRIQFAAPTITERHPTQWVLTVPVILPDGALIPASGS